MSGKSIRFIMIGIMPAQLTVPVASEVQIFLNVPFNASVLIV